MRFNGAYREAQFVRYFTVTMSFYKEQQDFILPVGEF